MLIDTELHQLGSVRYLAQVSVDFLHQPGATVAELLQAHLAKGKPNRASAPSKREIEEAVRARLREAGGEVVSFAERQCTLHTRVTFAPWPGS